MAWGYWAVVTGLALLFGMSLFSIAWLYASARHLPHTTGDLNEPDPASERHTKQKRAA
jgi:hypothetical protein